jgi:hypothetical protein
MSIEKKMILLKITGGKTKINVVELIAMIVSPEIYLFCKTMK